MSGQGPARSPSTISQVPEDFSRPPDDGASEVLGFSGTVWRAADEADGAEGADISGNPRKAENGSRAGARRSGSGRSKRKPAHARGRAAKAGAPEAGKAKNAPAVRKRRGAADSAPPVIDGRAPAVRKRSRVPDASPTPTPEPARKSKKPVAKKVEMPRAGDETPGTRRDEAREIAAGAATEPVPARREPRPRTRPDRATINRRRFLAGVSAGVVLGAVGFGVDELVGRFSSPPRSHALRPASRSRPRPKTAVKEVELDSGVTVPSAEWVVAENALPGTLAWLINAPSGVGVMQGYASAVSTTQGGEITLYADCPSPTFHVEAYRMGYYQGSGARLVWTSEEVPGTSQPPPHLTPTLNTIECAWSPSITVPVTSKWPPGTYLLKLVGSNQSQGFVPLCVRDDSSTAAFVVQNSVTTWQAYNLYGEYSLYDGPGGEWQTRSRVVSFDRPYSYNWAWGAADYVGNEFPLVHLMERLGLDVTYSTDLDLHANPAYLAQHQCLFSLGHDEYWSTVMRNAATDARDQGVNLVFLGSNACYRHIRLESSSVGPLRHQVCYKDEFETDDPMWGVDSAEVTSNWADGPDPRPQQSLIGALYVDVGASADLVVADDSSWILHGTGLSNGDLVPNLLLGEYDRYEPDLPGGPDNVDLVFHSPVTNRGNGAYANMTYYTSPGGGGVIDTGTAAWVNALFSQSNIPPKVVCPSGKVSPSAPTLTKIMENVFSVFGNGPAGETHASVSNYEHLLAGAPAPPPPSNSPSA